MPLRPAEASPLRPPRPRLVAGLALVLVALVLAAPIGAGAATPAAEEYGVVDVIEVDGLLDPILVDHIDRSLTAAADADAVALVLQLDSPGSVVDPDRLVRLSERLAASEVTVAMWVGPSGAEARGAAAQLLAVADVVGVAPGSRVGDLGEPVLPPEVLEEGLGPALPVLEAGTIGAERAEQLGLAAAPAPTIGDFVVTLPGFESQEVTQGDEIRLEPLTVVRFGQLPLVSQLMHTVASPSVAYLLLVVGLGLIVFELFTAGIGVAGVVGAASFILAGYGLWVLPTRPAALACLLLAFPAFAVDVQTGVPRLWTAVGGVLAVVGTLTLYDGVSMSWVAAAASLVGLALTFLAGMPAMVRTRFSTPTIGREWMVGELGLARGTVDPDGVVVVRGAPWRARTNRATPIADGQPVRVVALEGLLLEVEPTEGGARDHRER